MINASQKEVKMFEYFYNKMPDWSEVMKSYVLNFNGRIKISSSKNFQLIKENDRKLLFYTFYIIENFLKIKFLSQYYFSSVW